MCEELFGEGEFVIGEGEVFYVAVLGGYEDAAGQVGEVEVAAVGAGFGDDGPRGGGEWGEGL